MGCHVCVIYPPKSIEVHNSAVVSNRTFISGLNTSGGVGVSAVAQHAGRASTSGVQAALDKLRDSSCDHKTRSLKADVRSLYIAAGYSQ